MSDIIEICDLVIEASIGAYEWEKQNLQRIHIDLALCTDTHLPGQTDKLQDAIDYSEVAKQIQLVCKRRHFILVESLAEEIAEALLKRDGIDEMTIRITKPGAVAGAKSIRVTIKR